MRFLVTYVATAGLLLGKASADLYLYEANCDTGFGGFKEPVDGSFDISGINHEGGDPCGGETPDGSWGETLSFGNPCNPDDKMEIRGTELIVVGTGIKVGDCTQMHGGDFNACNGWSYACLNTPVVHCVTAYCRDGI
jgi:hypothetical protein